uniref:Uncharacterized protein n=1 Tax=Arundo donax TaxID=35708 RepID=A0A0A9U7V4_ARUDO
MSYATTTHYKIIGSRCSKVCLPRTCTFSSFQILIFTYIRSSAISHVSVNSTINNYWKI